MATLFQLPKAVPISSGNGYSGAKAYFYQSGTTTPITTYTTAALTVPHANPVVADANGVFAPIFIDESTNESYKLRLNTSSDVLIYEVDNIPAESGALPLGHLYNYGDNVTPGSTDMTSAFNTALAAIAGSGYALKLPGESVLITDQPNSIAGQVTIEGEGPFKSKIIFRPTAHNKAALKLSNGASRCERVVLRDFALYSDDTTYTKIGLDLYDLSVCVIERIFIYGTGGSGPSAGACWSGTSSIGIRTHGRESVSLTDIEVIADKPIVIAANPNTAATDGEDMDHWQWNNLDLVGNGNPLIEVDAGLGMEETRFEGYQAWVGGAGGFKMNDTRPSPVVPSRNISFKNIRTEQQTVPTDYAIDIASSFPIQQLVFENCLLASGSQGIKINAADHIVFQNVTTATGAGSHALNVTGQNSRATIRMDGCYWGGITANFTLTNYDPVVIEAFTSANFCGPCTASYVFDAQRPGTSLNMESLTATCANGATGLTVIGLTGDALQINPQSAGNGVSLRAVDNAENDFEHFAITGESIILRRRVATASATDAFILNADGSYSILDGVSAPATSAGFAKIYVDVADGDLKIKFGDGTVKTIVTDT